MAAMNKDTDPYGIKVLEAQGKADSITTQRAKQEENQRMFDQNRQFRGVMVKKYPDYADEINAIPDKDLFPMSQKLIERPTDSEYSVAATAVLPKGASHRNLTPEQANAVMEKVKENRVDTTARKAFETQIIKIDMPAPSRGGKGGGDPESKYAQFQDPETGEWGPKQNKEGKWILKSQVVTGITPEDRGKPKPPTPAEQRAMRKEARTNAIRNNPEAWLDPNKRDGLIKTEIDKLKNQGIAPKAGGDTPPAATPPGALNLGKYNPTTGKWE
jgi:hypothetical protein